MSRPSGAWCSLGLAVAAGLALVCVAHGEPPSPAPLHMLWEQHMLDGRSAATAVAVRDSRVDISEIAATQSFEFANGHPESASLTSHGISVMRLGEGFWGNGGWILEGGLLARALDGPATLELYGKAVVRQFAYFPFPFHREIPHETGYEFFLLRRHPGSQAIVIRKWVFPSSEVLIKRESAGGAHEDVRGTLRYEAGTRTAAVTITGLKRSFEERVDLTGVIQLAPR